MPDLGTAGADLSTERVFAELQSDAAMLHATIRQHLERNFAPDAQKFLRSFSSAEAADFLGLAPGHLRKLHAEGKIPEVPMDDRGRKVYSAGDLGAIRLALARATRDPSLYLRGRVGSEPLQIISCVSFKGGSAKTTTAAYLSQWFALHGYRVLAIDMDPQASLSSMMGLRPEIDFTHQGTVYDAIRYETPLPMDEVVRQTYFAGLDIAAGGLILSEYETETPYALRRGSETPFYLRLRDAIQSVEANYDVVFIDCPPQLGFLTLSALVASSSIIIPVVANFIDVASLAQFLTMTSSLLDTIREAGMTLEYDFLRYLVSRFEPSDGPQAQVAGLLRANFGKRVMTEAFLKSTAISDAGLTHQTLFEVGRASMIRNTYDRAMESVNAVARELEQEVHRAWGRI
ncbi:MAG: plasmid partitioning protein RepA [Halothiobacillaceae bacterium]